MAAVCDDVQTAAFLCYNKNSPVMEAKLVWLSIVEKIRTYFKDNTSEKFFPVLHPVEGFSY